MFEFNHVTEVSFNEKVRTLFGVFSSTSAADGHVRRPSHTYTRIDTPVVSNVIDYTHTLDCRTEKLIPHFPFFYCSYSQTSSYFELTHLEFYLHNL